jgi:hypothetical protein
MNYKEVLDGGIVCPAPAPPVWTSPIVTSVLGVSNSAVYPIVVYECPSFALWADYID